MQGAETAREGRREEEIIEMLKELISPSQEIIQWVVDTMHGQHEVEIEEKERLRNSIKTQIDRLERRLPV